jgi:hypothetical protein
MSRRKKLTQKEVSEGLRRLAFGEIQDAVSLLFESEENILHTLPKLDLFNVSEIKRVKGGGMEIKFFDRLKALDKLSQVVNSNESMSASSFYDALEKSAVRATNDFDGDAYE